MNDRILNVVEKQIHAFNSVFKQYALAIGIALSLLIAFIYVLLNGRLLNFHSNTFFFDIIEPVFTILTFCTALLIGWYNIYLNWINSLEKRLTVFYVFYYDSLENLGITLKSKNFKEDQIEKQKNFVSTLKLKPKTSYCLIICEEALLAHEGDIRNWGQQLGSQYETQGRLSFHPFFTLGCNYDISEKKIGNKRMFLTQHLIFFFLDKIPDTIIDNAKGILSTDNFDDCPTNTVKKFEIKEIPYSKLLKYKEAKEFIKSI